jgi:hypothetical protein
VLVLVLVQVSVLVSVPVLVWPKPLVQCVRSRAGAAYDSACGNSPVTNLLHRTERECATTAPAVGGICARSEARGAWMAR